MVHLHRDCTGRTPLGAETALDTPGFLFEDDRRSILFSGLFYRRTVIRLYQIRKVLIPFDLIQPCHPETEFWTDIHTPATEDTFRPIEDGKDVALEASDGLSDCRLP